MINKFLFFFLSSLMVISCVEKEFDPANPAGSFEIAKEPYDDSNFEIAITKLGEYKSRFPYSQFAVLAELYLANSQFELGQFVEAAASYEQFVKLHPKHEQVDFAMFRIGECYWADASEDEDRDQDLTQKAIDQWRNLIQAKPDSNYSKQAKDLIEQGRTRLAGGMLFVVKFYCKQDLPHACASRALELAERYPDFKEIRKEALTLAASSLEIVAKNKEAQPDSDKNLYFANLSVEAIREKASAARKLAAE